MKKERIRLAIKSDINQIKVLLNSSKELSLRGIKGEFSEKNIKDYFNKKLDKIIVYILDKKIIGVLIAQLWIDYSYIDLVVIDKKFRGKGLGKHLMNYLEKIIREKKIREIEIITEDTNKGMRNLLEELNYKRGKNFIAYTKKIK